LSIQFLALVTERWTHTRCWCWFMYDLTSAYEGGANPWGPTAIWCCNIPTDNARQLNVQNLLSYCCTNHTIPLL